MDPALEKDEYGSYSNINYPPEVGKADKIHVFEYDFILFDATDKWHKFKAELQAERERIKAKDAEGAFGFIMPLQSDTKPGPVEPRVFIVHGPPPELPDPPAAHLYLSNKHYIGGGHHSHVYRADLDLPRDSLVPEVFCKECAIQDVLKKVEAEDGPNGETKAEEWKEKSGVLKCVWKIKDRKVDLNVFYAQDPNIINTITLGEDQGEWVVEYEGPLRRIRTDVGYQNPLRGRPYCEHVKQHDFGSSALHPNTARVRVIVKIQRRDDNRLVRESWTYTSFPEHFSEHWSGYNSIPPLHDPVPIGAIVPQYYGTYQPAHSVDAKRFSPILLLEDCGERVKRWRADDRCVIPPV